MRPWLSLLLVLLPLTPFEIVVAQSVQVQPIYGFSWPTHSIPVTLEASTPNAREALSRAIRTWNLAQQWFITTYMAGDGEAFVFYETNSAFDSMVVVSFNQTQTTDDLGVTNWQAFRDKQGNFQKVNVDISIDLTRNDGQVLSDDELQTLATHELGHALGLDHTTFSANDLMNHVPKVRFPSTLNLYTVYLLSQSTKEEDLPQQPVSLPSTMSYMMVSEADLEGVTPPMVQTTETTSFGVTELVSTLTYGPWLYVGLLAVLAGVIIASTLRRRKRSLAELEPSEGHVIFREEPIVEDRPSQTKKKMCRYCGAEVRQENLICAKCGMPTYT